MAGTAFTRQGLIGQATGLFDHSSVASTTVILGGGTGINNLIASVFLSITSAGVAGETIEMRDEDDNTLLALNADQTIQGVAYRATSIEADEEIRGYPILGLTTASSNKAIKLVSSALGHKGSYAITYYRTRMAAVD